ncbi:helix-turn-helix domain-containing protein [Streptomyces sp. NBC_01445]|uniref:helix-turn-helix domain-containing protein n=1 Tax=Streptomyces sp. NBC_01445 TaxID=2903869 RepID=UPI002DDA07D0|nr:helix-turn-helix transcriptional regulator [Streptomyces sp. NBC_01445]WSE01978.1 helix-turn-helix transcriptional regulator [Streptomyces sp. NBC_01445]WSE10353.1 helix-turn-helix transcriptional regulator [Streptomyces sp. NBC_01445]WSE11081.1 helix-turn-helix transcriptional regulator [Streptomyces sp. NBC_01445]
MKWNLRWVAAKRDIWRPSDLKTAFEEVGFTPSLSKVCALWSAKPLTLRLDDLDMICAALQCTVADLMEAEPLAAGGDLGERPQAVGEQPRAGSGQRPVPKQTGEAGVRRLPPN